MASFSPSSTLLITTPSNSPSRPNFFAKPSYFLTHHAKIPSTRFWVSCNARNGEPNMKDDSKSVDPKGKVDRRNMLFGLGGLYGAANLASNQLAMANPIQPPNLDKCGLSSYEEYQDKIEHQVPCCPPKPLDIIDYKLPPVHFMRTRPSAHRVTPEYIFKYNTAIDRMKRLPADDPRNFMQQANIHCAYCNGAYAQTGQSDDSLKIQVHKCWLFFPFHRWYLYFFERICQKLINDPTFSLPFWNWDNPMGMTMPPMFADPGSALYDKNRNVNSIPPNIVDLGMTKSNDPLNLVTNNLATMYNEMIRANHTAADFMGKPYCIGTPENPGDGSSERGSHTAVHIWVGDPRNPAFEDLGNFYSAGRDPLFYCHHANVDRMWTLWQYYVPSEKLCNKRITDPDFLDASFVFYDENKQLVRVNVRDSLDNKRMGYEYQRIDLPWLNYRPPPQTAKAKVYRDDAPKPESIFPVVVDRIIRVIVPKAKIGKAEEILVLKDIVVDPTKIIKVDIFVNDDDDNFDDLNKASYAGSYAQVPHKTSKTTAKSTINLKLTEVYEDMDVEGDDSILVTLVPRHRGGGITIGGIKIIEATTKSS